MTSARKLCRWIFGIVLLAQTVWWLGGCALVPEAERGYSPSTMTYRQALAAAQIAQRQYPGSTILQAVGISMLPKYGNNTLFVVKPIAWGALKAGMDVAYKRPNGDTYVHELETDGGDFWIVKGINNNEPDYFHVTPENLIGQVRATFSYDMGSAAAK